MPHDLLLFDLDGTLSDPVKGICRAFNFALESFDYDPLSENVLASLVVGPPLDVSFREITGIVEAPKIKALVEAYRDCYAQIGYAENELYSGVFEALMDLAQANVAMAICTSKRVDFAECILEMFDIRQFFTFVNGGDIGISKGQQIAGLIAQGAIPANTVMIGDRGVDLEAAHQNSLDAAGVLWGYGSQAELSVHSPRYLFHSPTEWSRLVSADS